MSALNFRILPFTQYCRARKDLSENVWVVALIVYRFRDRRKKHTWLFYMLIFKIPNTRLVKFSGFWKKRHKSCQFALINCSRLVASNFIGLTDFNTVEILPRIKTPKNFKAFRYLE